MKTRQIIPTILSVILLSMIAYVLVVGFIIPQQFENECVERGGYVTGYLSCTHHVDDANNLLQSEKQACVDLFDQIFYDKEQFRKENPPKPGDVTVEPASLSSVIIDSKFGQDFRNSDCKNTVN